MSAATTPNKRTVTGFRTKLLAAMMLVISAITALGLYLAQRDVTANANRALQQDFQTQLSSLHELQELRHAALAERCRALAEKPRIHAALEDNALDLLYPSAKDELRDLMERGEPRSGQAASTLHAGFYRFLDGDGAVLPPPNSKDVGGLSKAAEAQLALNKLPEKQEVGYIWQDDSAGETVNEVTAVPILSTETGDVISALIVGFKPFEPVTKNAASGIKSGIWVGGRLYLPSLSKPAKTILTTKLARLLANGDRAENSSTVRINGARHLLFFKRLNPESLFRSAYEICVYPLDNWVAQLHRLRLKIGGAGALLLLGAFVVSHFAAARLSRPVEQLEIESEQERAERERAEAALASTADELERSARYSADASHQLKSPLTVLRAGLETLLAREDFKPEVYEELSGLLHQTHRLTGMIDDLLLLSRMDAGHLQIASEPVNLSELLEEWLDDLEALPDAPEVTIEKDIAANLAVAGEKQYTSLIVQNLLENARKYNRTGGRIRILARRENKHVLLAIGNTGRSIERNAQRHIFERFRSVGDGSVSGHGLGLNLARELARLHGGDLRLIRSENDWTEFEARFRVMEPKANRVAGTK
ncbi:MAG TPA: HAMP domain-containing sensor histidine kinase [Chthoniobacterales bacterium]|jgi:signal transduction histidine kinase|nr:HAMP domain-containing sensor histidine kinase [Chthoniobacterales bacterium]